MKWYIQKSKYNLARFVNGKASYKCNYLLHLVCTQTHCSHTHNTAKLLLLISLFFSFPLFWKQLTRTAYKPTHAHPLLTSQTIHLYTHTCTYNATRVQGCHFDETDDFKFFFITGKTKCTVFEFLKLYIYIQSRK